MFVQPAGDTGCKNEHSWWAETTHVYFFLCFRELSLRHSGNARKVTTIFYTVRYCVLPWDVLIHYTHKSTQQPALLAILNILTPFHLLDQNFARNSHFLKHAACPPRLSCLFMIYKYRPKVFGSYLSIYQSLQYHRNTDTRSKTAETNLEPSSDVLRRWRTHGCAFRKAGLRKQAYPSCVCVCVCVCVCFL